MCNSVIQDQVNFFLTFSSSISISSSLGKENNREKGKEQFAQNHNKIILQFRVLKTECLIHSYFLADSRFL